MGGADERKVAAARLRSEIERRYPCEIPRPYPIQEFPMRKRIYTFAFSLMAFLAVSAPALANGNWGG